MRSTTLRPYCVDPPASMFFCSRFFCRSYIYFLPSFFFKIHLFSSQEKKRCGGPALWCVLCCVRRSGVSVCQWLHIWKRCAWTTASHRRWFFICAGKEGEGVFFFFKIFPTLYYQKLRSSGARRLDPSVLYPRLSSMCALQSCQHFQVICDGVDERFICRRSIFAAHSDLSKESVN